MEDYPKVASFNVSLLEDLKAGKNCAREAATAIEQLEAELASKQAAHDAEIAKLKADLEQSRSAGKNLFDEANRINSGLHSQLSTANERIAYLEGLVAALHELLARIGEYPKHGAWTNYEVMQMIFNTQATAQSYEQEVEARGAVKALEKYDWLWRRCRIIFFPNHDDSLGTYPIEHNPHANKDGRMFIEGKMAEELRATSKK